MDSVAQIWPIQQEDVDSVFRNVNLMNKGIIMRLQVVRSEVTL